MGHHNKPLRTVERRDVLKLLGGATAAFGGLGVATYSAGAREDSTVGQGLICDVSTDGEFTAQMPLANDPEGERNTVVHATSGGQQTRDYVCSTIDLSDVEYTLGEVANAGLSYDYYEGSANTGAAPDEVFLTFQQGNDFYVAYKTLDADTSSEEWHTRTVSSELAQSGWRTTQIDRSQINPQGKITTTSNQAITDAIGLLQQEPTTNLRNEFSADAQLMAVTLGLGSVTTPHAIDVYVDSLTVGEDSFAIPGVVVLDAAFDNVQYATEAFHVHLSSELAGVSLEAIDPSSVRLAQYTEIGPPVPGTQAERRALPPDDGQTGLINDLGLRIDFNRNRLRGQADVGDQMLLYGDFTYPDAVDHPLSFVATSPLAVED